MSLSRLSRLSRLFKWESNKETTEKASRNAIRTAENALTIYTSAYERDIMSLIALAQTSRSLSNVAQGLLRTLVSMVKDVTVLELSTINRQLFIANAHYMTGHSSWFLCASRCGLLGYISTPTTRGEIPYEPRGIITRGRVDCALLGCLCVCNPILSYEEQIVLLAIIAQRGLDYTQIPQSYIHRLLAALIDHDSCEHWIMLMLYREFPVSLMVRIFASHPLFLRRYGVWIREMAALSNYWGLLYTQLRISDNSGCDIVTTREYEAYGIARLILYDINSNYHIHATALGTIGHTALVAGIVTASRIIRSKSDPAVSMIYIVTSTNESTSSVILFERDGEAMSIVAAIVTIVNNLIDRGPQLGWPIVTPIGAAGVCMTFNGVILPSIYGTMMHYAGTSRYVRFVVVCYLFGISSATVIATADDLFPIAFRREDLFTMDTIMISDLVYEMGGRSSELYNQFRNAAITLLCEWRRHYSLVSHMLLPLNLPYDAILHRWCPSLGGEILAIRRFTETLERSSKGKLGWWTLLGY